MVARRHQNLLQPNALRCAIAMSKVQIFVSMAQQVMDRARASLDGEMTGAIVVQLIITRPLFVVFSVMPRLVVAMVLAKEMEQVVLAMRVGRAPSATFAKRIGILKGDARHIADRTLHVHTMGGAIRWVSVFARTVGILLASLRDFGIMVLRRCILKLMPPRMCARSNVVSKSKARKMVWSIASGSVTGLSLNVQRDQHRSQLPCLGTFLMKRISPWS